MLTSAAKADLELPPYGWAEAQPSLGNQKLFARREEFTG